MDLTSLVSLPRLYTLEDYTSQEPQGTSNYGGITQNGLETQLKDSSISSSYEAMSASQSQMVMDSVNRH